MVTARPARLLAALTAVGALVAGPALQGSADAASSLRTWKTGTVKAVADGDTIWVDYAGDRTKKTYKVRLAGVQATETKHRDLPGSTNWCHGQKAGAVLRSLVLGKKVRLRALHEGSRSQGRPLRFVYVKRGGVWTDVQALLLQRSQVMNFNFPQEWTNDARYSQLAQQAAAGRRGLWDSDACGSGPAQSVPLRTWVHWDAQGLDERNLNDEYAVFENRSMTTPLRLAGWMVRDTTQSVYRFPSWAVIAPNSYVKLHVGRGTNTATDFYWGKNETMFQNPDARGKSDVVVLMDPHGDFRSWGAYPCRWACSEPYAGKLTTGPVVYDPEGNDALVPNEETFTVRNASDQPLRLSGYSVVMNGWYAYAFSPNRTLAPGATITFHVGEGTSTATDIHLGMTGSHLPNGGGTITIVNWTGHRLACTDWGSKHC